MPVSTSTVPPETSRDIDSRRLVQLHPERVTNVSSTDFPGHYAGEEGLHGWDLDKFKENLRVIVTRLSNRSVEFDLVGVDASIANAIRRVLIAEVPTMCIEDVFVMNNTSVIQDEVLAHRLGMVPLNADPDVFTYRDDSNGQATDRNTLVFHLNVSCTRNTEAPPNTTDSELLFNNSIVTSGDLLWVPQGEQADLEMFQERKPGPTNADIVLAKMRPGQEISMELHAIKGVGKEHAKWSPVATASYRLLPHVALKSDKPVPPHLVDKFAKCFSPGVIKVDSQTRAVGVDPVGVRNETMSREVFRHPELAECVTLGRVRDWFLFNIESEGPYAPERLLPSAIRVLRHKLAVLRKAADVLDSGEDEYMDKVDEDNGMTTTVADAQGDVVMMES